MVEHVEARVQGPDDSHVRFKVEAIALDDKDVASLATAMQQRIEEACDTMLGTPVRPRASVFAVQDYRPDRGGFR